MGLLSVDEKAALEKNTPTVKVWDEDGNQNTESVKKSNVSTVSNRRTKKNADSFVVHNKYGMGGNESEEEDADILDKVVDKTPMT